MSKSRFMLGALIAGLAASLFAQEPVPPRVALLATTLNADSEKFLDVATAELTARGGLELVERQAIRQVLGEQALALQQDASGVAAGRLLRADVVGVLETTPDGKEAGGFAVLDTATGVSYWSEGLDQTDIEGVAGEMARGVAAALEKRGRAGALGTVCVLGARNAEFPRNMDVFCETTAYLLERRLVANPALATLDRRRLETVVAENNLPGVESKSAALRASLRLVELDFRRGAADGEIKVLARVTDAGGALIAQPEVAGPQDAAELAERVQTALAEVLHAAPPAAVGNRAQEANRFRTQGKILRDRGLVDQSIQAFHAAYALDPGTPKQLEEYVSQVMDYAYSLADKGMFAQALELGRAALDIEDRWQVRHAHMGEHGGDDFLKMLNKCKRNAPPADPVQGEIETLRLRYLAEMGLTGISGEPSGLKSGPSGQNYVGGVIALYPVDFSEELRFPVDAALSLSPTAEEFFRLLDGRLAGWLEREADFARPHDAGVIATLYALCGRVYRHVWDDLGFPPFDEAYVRGVRSVSARFRSHPRLVVQLEGRYFDVLIDREVAARDDRELPDEAVKTVASKMIADALAALEQPGAVPPGDVGYVLEMAARAAKLQDFYRERPRTAAVADSYGCYEDLQRIAQAMFDHRLVSGAILRTLLWSQDADFTRHRLPVLRRLQAARDDRSFTRINIPRSEIDDMLKALPADAPAAVAGCPARILWATPQPANWRNRLVGLQAHDEKFLYAFAGWQPDQAPNKGSLLDVLRIDLADGRMEKIGAIQPRTCWANQYPNAISARGCQGLYVVDTTFSDTHVWLATSGDGVFGVPLSGGGEPVRIGTADGLPSDVIHSAAAVGDRLYLGCGQYETEGYLVVYDLVRRSCQVLASTMRASPETPLDSLKGGFRITKIVPDAFRNRLLLVLNNGDLQPATGLWEYRLDTEKFRQILSIERPARFVETAADGKLWIYPYCRNEWRPIREKGGWYGGIEFDPARDFARLAFATKNKQAGYYLPVLSTTRVIADMFHDAAVVADGWLFHFAGITVDGKGQAILRRTSLTTGAAQVIEGFEPGQNLFQWGWLKWLPQSRVLLAGNGNRIFAVRISE
ncbi:MAG TPA: hypothetical protein P5204_08105 [Kiritimatiellia bacterium]|nr:hypothetical protein [Kiritimatiellia bacterium]